MSPDQVKPNKRAAPKEAPKSAHGMTTRRQKQANDKGQESPAPVAPEEKASGAGGLRPAVVIFSLRGGFLTVRRFSGFNGTEGRLGP
jgi:hypothetical protein